MPAKDEAENLPALVGVDYELVIVDDHSADGTAAVAAELGRHHPVIVVIPRNSLPGKGYALLDGFARGLGPRVCTMDADLRYPSEAIPEMVAMVRAGADVVVANRVRQQTSTHVRPSAGRSTSTSSCRPRTPGTRLPATT